MGGSQAAVILANNPAPGETYFNAGGSNAGQAIGNTGWYYNNVRNGASVGIDTSYARNGNASVHFNAPNNGKADVEFLPNAVSVGGNFAATSTLGKFTDLSSMSYDWYRDSVSTANSHLHAALRVLLDLDGDLTTVGDRGGLVFERVYNGGAVGVAVPTNVWNSDVVSAAANVWSFGLAGLSDINADGYAYDDTLAQWQSSSRLSNAVIIGFSSGVGSGWSPYVGSVDNIRWTIAGVTTTSNFEVAGATAVPEPGTLALAGLSLVGLAAVRRARQA